MTETVADVMDAILDEVLARPIYPTSPIKRARATRDEVEYRRERLLGIIRAMKPMTVRQAYTTCR